jgi:rubrerythrin
VPAKKPKPIEAPVEHHWICEGCDGVSVGVDPPDVCDVCGHRYFENLADVCDEAEDAELH